MKWIKDHWLLYVFCKSPWKITFYIPTSIIYVDITHPPTQKWPPFHRRHFQMNFHENSCILIQRICQQHYFVGLCINWVDWYYVGNSAASTFTRPPEHDGSGFLFCLVLDKYELLNADTSQIAKTFRSPSIKHQWHNEMSDRPLTHLPL